MWSFPSRWWRGRSVSCSSGLCEKRLDQSHWTRRLLGSGLVLKLSDFFARFCLTSCRLLMYPNYVLVFLSPFATTESKNLICPSSKQAKIVFFLRLSSLDYLFYLKRDEEVSETGLIDYKCEWISKCTSVNMMPTAEIIYFPLAKEEEKKNQQFSHQWQQLLSKQESCFPKPTFLPSDIGWICS